MQHAELMVRRHCPALPCLTESSRQLPSNILKYDRKSERQQMNNGEGCGRRGADPGKPSGNFRRSYGLREQRNLRHFVLPVTGGTPITESTAIALRRIVFGQCPTTIRAEFFTRGPGFVFRQAESDLGYALTVGNALGVPVIRAILMAVQAHVLRALLFDVRVARFYRPNPLTPSYTMQQEALCIAFTDIMWRAGGGLSSVVCLPHLTHCHVADSEKFNKDGVTEKLQLFHFDNREGLYQLFRRYLSIFQQDPGPAIILLLYSLILSRGIDRVIEDLGACLISGPDTYHGHLFNYAGDINFSALNLFLVGWASPYLHNGTQYEENENHVIVAETGIPIRAAVGLLIWMRTEEKTVAYNLGSRLKTPIYPIWLIISSDQSGVLFSEDRDLLRNYKSEIRFKLQYYSSSHHQLHPAVLAVRTRMRPDETDGPEESFHTLDKIIRTKWAGARVMWNGQKPFL